MWNWQWSHNEWSSSELWKQYLLLISQRAQGGFITPLPPGTTEFHPRASVWVPDHTPVFQGGRDITHLHTTSLLSFCSGDDSRVSLVLGCRNGIPLSVGMTMSIIFLLRVTLCRHIIVSLQRQCSQNGEKPTLQSQNETRSQSKTIEM